MKTTLVETQANLKHAQKWMVIAMNRSHGSQDYQLSDEVVVSTETVKNHWLNLPARIKDC